MSPSSIRSKRHQLRAFRAISRSPVSSASLTNSVAPASRAATSSGRQRKKKRAFSVAASAAWSPRRRAISTACCSTPSAASNEPVKTSALARLTSILALSVLSSSPRAPRALSRSRAAASPGSPGRHVVSSNPRAACANSSASPHVLAISAARWKVSMAFGYTPARLYASSKATSSVQRCASSTGAWLSSACRALS
jgi:hypothetical protein